jgi:tRNA(Ile)-lysidine synthase
MATSAQSKRSSARDAGRRLEESRALRDRVARNLDRRCGVAPGSRLLVGVSGGCDSVALVRILCELAPTLRLSLVVAHFDHQLRADSTTDVAFVRDLARNLGLDVQVDAWTDPRRGEAAARRARHDFLQRTALDAGCDGIALGHQLDDQIETVLLRLGRGTGLRGLLGIPWRRKARVDIVRPLLDIRRRELAAYLGSIGQLWREDSTNADLTRTRNRIRARVLPELDATFGARWREKWSLGQDELRAVWSHLELEAEDLLRRARPNGTLGKADQVTGADELATCDRVLLQEAPEVLQGFALRAWLERSGCADLSREHLEACLDLLRNGQSGQGVDLPGGFRFRVGQQNVTLVAPPIRVGDALGRKTSEPPTFQLLTAEVPVDEALARLASRPRSHPERPSAGTLPTSDEVLIGADRVPEPIEVRTFHAGERVRMLGAPGSRTVARLMQDRRIPGLLRPIWPVVADADGIVWIPGVGIAERCRVGLGTRRVLELSLVRKD